MAGDYTTKEIKLDSENLASVRLPKEQKTLTDIINKIIKYYASCQTKGFSSVDYFYPRLGLLQKPTFFGISKEDQLLSDGVSWACGLARDYRERLFEGEFVDINTNMDKLSEYLRKEENVVRGIYGTTDSFGLPYYVCVLGVGLYRILQSKRQILNNSIQLLNTFDMSIVDSSIARLASVIANVKQPVKLSDEVVKFITSEYHAIVKSIAPKVQLPVVPLSPEYGLRTMLYGGMDREKMIPNINSLPVYEAILEYYYSFPIEEVTPPDDSPQICINTRDK